MNISGFQKLFKPLPSLPCLQVLELDFYLNDKISNVIISSITESLQTCKNLKALGLDFSECNQVTEVGLQGFLEVLSKLSNLEMISICFPGKDMKDAFLIAVCDILSTFQKLTSLTLDLTECQQVTDDGVTIATEKLSKLKNLTYYSSCLQLHPKQNKITEKSAISLIILAKAFPNVKSVDLHFLDFSSLSKESLEQLASTISNHNNLVNLELALENCSQLKDEDFTILVSTLKLKKDMQCIYLDFTDGPNLSQDFVAKLEEELGQKIRIDY